MRRAKCGLYAAAGVFGEGDEERLLFCLADAQFVGADKDGIPFKLPHVFKVDQIAGIAADKMMYGQLFLHLPHRPPNAQCLFRKMKNKVMVQHFDDGNLVFHKNLPSLNALDCKNTLAHNNPDIMITQNLFN